MKAVFGVLIFAILAIHLAAADPTAEALAKIEAVVASAVAENRTLTHRDLAAILNPPKRDIIDITVSGGVGRARFELGDGTTVHLELSELHRKPVGDWPIVYIYRLAGGQISSLYSRKIKNEK